MWGAASRVADVGGRSMRIRFSSRSPVSRLAAFTPNPSPLTPHVFDPSRLTPNASRHLKRPNRKIIGGNNLNFLNEGKVGHIARDQDEALSPGRGCDQGFRLRPSGFISASLRILRTYTEASLMSAKSLRLENPSASIADSGMRYRRPTLIARKSPRRIMDRTPPGLQWRSSATSSAVYVFSYWAVSAMALTSFCVNHGL